ncbi:MAG: hypothetical protein IPN22_14205 [Bacteroidetes bacterium]|nr:hypothetical protein [Bacteroidota bacterium]
MKNRFTQTGSAKWCSAWPMDFGVYVRKAFPDDERILRVWFCLTYVANGARFVVNAYTMYSIMEDYLVQLQAAGMPLTFEAQLDTELSKLAEGEINQEVIK